MNVLCIFREAACCEMLIPGALPPDWMLAAAVHVRARRRGREGAEVERQGSGGGPGGVPPPESIEHLVTKKGGMMGKSVY